jgi:hypothetical protein
VLTADAKYEIRNTGAWCVILCGEIWMTEKKYYSSASVVFEVRVKGKGFWGPEATVSEVQRNGGNETVSAIENALRGAGLRWEHVNPPKVGAITWEAE